MTVTSGAGYPPTVHEKTPAEELSSSLGAVTDTDSFSGTVYSDVTELL